MEEIVQEEDHQDHEEDEEYNDEVIQMSTSLPTTSGRSFLQYDKKGYNSIATLHEEEEEEENVAVGIQTNSYDDNVLISFKNTLKLSFY